MVQLSHKVLQFMGHRIPLNRVADPVFRRLVAAIGGPPPQTEVAIADGRSFRVFRTRPNRYVNHPDFYIYYFGVWEPREERALRRFVRRGDVCIDVGANIGWYSLLLAKLVGSEGQVHAFEPEPRVFAHLLENLEINPWATNVYAHEVALSEEDGYAELQAGDDLLLSSLFNVSRTNMGGAKTYRVAKVSLDTYIDQNQIARVELLKIDAEGSEFPVLKGATRLLGDSKHRPVLLIELNPETSRAAGYGVKQMADWLTETYGYYFYKISRLGKLSPIAKPETLGLTDVIAMCPEFHEQRLSNAGG